MKAPANSKPASAGIFAPSDEKSELADKLARQFPTDAIIRMQRPDGREYFLRVPGEHLDRVIELAGIEFKGIVR